MAQISTVATIILNHFVRADLNNRAPVTAFTGLPADNPLRLLVSEETKKCKYIDFIKAQQLVKVNQIHSALAEMHRDVAQSRTRARKAAVKRHNERTHVQPVNFEVGDYVLVAHRTNNRGPKLNVKWKGPRRIVRAVSEFVYEVEDLLSQAFPWFMRTNTLFAILQEFYKIEV